MHGNEGDEYMKNAVQRFGKFLSAMVMPNIGAFIAWGLITALFIEKGWFPNAKLATMVDPMLKYILPVSYTHLDVYKRQKYEQFRVV